jgi:hypothetical protein
VPFSDNGLGVRLKLSHCNCDGVSSGGHQYRTTPCVGDEDVSRITLAKELNRVIRVTSPCEHSQGILRPDQHLPKSTIWNIGGLGRQEGNSGGVSFRHPGLLYL